MKNQTLTKPIEENFEKAPVEEPVAKSYEGVATERVNVRAEANLESEVLRVLDKDEVVPLSSKKVINGFYAIEGGFVKKEYLKIKEN